MRFEGPENLHSIASYQLLHGWRDTVVLVEQADEIYQSIKARGGYVEKKVYSQEGHGFSQEETIKDALQAEIKFYEKIFALNQSQTRPVFYYMYF